jgi:hypothetical protein
VLEYWNAGMLVFPPVITPKSSFHYSNGFLMLAMAEKNNDRYWRRN